MEHDPGLEPQPTPNERAVFGQPEIFSEGKAPNRNEDASGFNGTTLVVCDGVTDKSGLDYDGKTGGEIASRLVVDTVLASEASGMELVREVSEKLWAKYGEMNPDALTDASRRFGATMVAVKLEGGEIVVTHVGDTAFRINGTDVYTNPMEVSVRNAKLRKDHIDQTGDVEGGREVIMPALREQYKLQNNAADALGYGVIDGTEVPEKFVHVYRFPRSQVHTIELVSDGYPAFPDVASVGAYEWLYEEIQREDPHRYKLYPSTKVADDRTVLIETLL